MDEVRKNNFKYLEYLTDKEIRDIHHATLSVLESVGVKVYHEKALQMLGDAGANVDLKSQIARIPAEVVEEWITKAPSSFTLYARDENNNLNFQDGITHYVAAHTTPFAYDLDTGARRSATYEDAQNFSKLSDYLEYIADGYCMVFPQDVPDRSVHAYILMAQIKNSDKVLKGRINGKVIAKDCIHMAEMIAGGENELKKKPNMMALMNCLSPLMLDKVQVEGLIEYAKKGLPFIIASEIMSGATGPVTLAGTLVQQNAEILSHIIIAQMINPGTPVIYGSASSIMDMKTSTLRYGAIEEGLIDVAVVQLARYYKIPSRISAGCTDSKMLDMQAGFESAKNLALASVSGANYISYAAGGLDSALSTSYEKVVIDHENIKNMVRAQKGIKINQETLAVNVIKDVGPGGQYLTHNQTLEKFKEEHLIPELVNTDNYQDWEKMDKKDIKDRAREKVKNILKTHTPPPLDQHLNKELNEFIKNIEKRS